MRKASKFLALLLSVVMVLTVAIPVAFADEIAFSDVPASHRYYEAITNLAAEGILNGMGDGAFAPEGDVTRAQFAKIICYALSVGNLTYSKEQKSLFSDVSPDHWAADNIKTAYDQKIINGMGDGTFAPEKNVLYEQAVKMAVCALGYTEAQAERNGGYPMGYMTLANKAGILKGIADAKQQQPMKRGAVAQLIDNMLDADQIVDGEAGGSIREEIGTTKKVEGRAVAAYGVSIYYGETSTCSKNQIEIEIGTDREIFDISEINIDVNDYLGRSVVVYYEDESGVTIKSATNISLQSRKNETTKIDFDMIYDYDATSIEYYTNSARTNTKKVYYETSSDNLVNGEAVSQSLQSIITSNMGQTGTITLVCSSGGSTADVAFVKVYETLVVKSKDARTYKVYGKNIHTTGYTYLLDVTDSNKQITIKNAQGSTLNFSAIAENYVLSIAANSTGSVIEVLVSSKSESGTIVEADSGSIKLDKSSAVYPVHSSPYGTGGTLTVGNYVTITLDAFGKVARFVVSEKYSYNYGYLSDLEYGSFTDEYVDVMIYKASSSSGTPTGKIYRLADSVKIDNQRYNVSEDMLTIAGKLSTSALAVNEQVGSTSLSNHTYAQPIRYTVNSANQVDAILTNASTGDNATSMNIVKFMPSTSAITCTVDNTTLEQYTITSSTPIIFIPADRGSSSYRTYSNSFFDDGVSYYVQIANSVSNKPGAIYVYGTSTGGSAITSTITEDTVPMVVTKIVDSMYNNTATKKFELANIETGETVYCYDGDHTGTGALDTLLVGDVIRVALDSDMYVDEIQVLANAVQVVADGFTYTGNYFMTDGSGSGRAAEFRSLIATVKSTSGNDFVVLPGYSVSGAASSEETYTYSSDVKVYLVDTNETEAVSRVKEVLFAEVIGESNQSGNASTILVYTRSNNLKGIVIFK